MPVLTVTFDHTTDTLTVPAHGQVTGNGPGALRNVGGALPAALAALTDYWLYVVDANTVKLATSAANALAGVTVAFADNGSGTTYLEIGLPYRRDVTHTAGSQVRSATMNSIEDSLKALHALFTGQAQGVWTTIGRGAQKRKTPACAGHALSGAFDNTGRWVSSANGQQLMIPIVVNEGEHIKEIKISAVADSAQTVACTLYRAAESGVAGLSASETVSTTAVFAGVNLTIDESSPGVPLDVVVSNDGATYYLYCVTTGAPGGLGCMIGGATVTTTVPV